MLHPSIRRNLIIAAVALLLATSCASKEKTSRPASEQSPEAAFERAKTEDKSADRADRDESLEERVRAGSKTTGLERLVKSNTRFSFDLHRAVGGDTVVYSPYSIAMAVAMLEAGAAERTREQIRTTLRVDLPEDDLHDQTSRLRTEIVRRGASDDIPAAERIRLHVVNALWGQDGLDVAGDFGRMLQMNYNADFHTADFRSRPDDARKAINAYVAESTAGKIAELMPKGAVHPLTRLVLTNTVYLNAPWHAPFNRDETKLEDFTTLGGEKTRVHMMFGAKPLSYFEGQEFKAVEIPYRGLELAALVILPDEGKFREVDAALSAGRYDWLTSRLESRVVRLHLPRFEVSSKIPLKAVLTSMGMPDAFDAARANFSGIASKGGDALHLSDILHETRISVDEAGTEAAAASAGGMATKMHQWGEPREMRVDRPFIFAIRDRKTGTVLFLGRITSI